MNNFRLTINNNDGYINIPVNINFDNAGKDDLISVYEDEVIEKIINPAEDFETTRFSNKLWTDVDGKVYSKIKEEFYFFDRLYNISATTVNINNWVADYNFVNSAVFQNFSGITFNNKELYYFANSFSRSFFKLDLYDTPNSETQKIMLTIVIPTQQGITKPVNIGTNLVPISVDVRQPIFNLDFVGDKEGYFIYWLKDTSYININEFYMSAKFFNAKTGQFIRMLNRPQISIPNRFNFPNNEFYYYKVVLNYNTYEYEIFKTFGNQNRVGTNTEPIKWYEYVNNT